jgi:hypothetical protein
MDISVDPWSGFFEVEKIINSKTYRNKKYYLVKWLCYPIHESTWEPKSNLKNLNYMIDTFEAEYPYSVDQEMYEIYCNELKKRNKRRRNKGKNSEEFPINTNFLSKKKKMEFFSESELRDTYFDKLKNHLHLNMVKRLSKEHKGDLFIELSLNSTKSDENENIEDSEKENMNSSDDKKNSNQLIVPILI